MKQTRRTYTREFKLEALRLLETSGKSAAQIERDLGIGTGAL
jgi:transposase-like protein